VQFSERDGRRQRVVPEAFGIFGHGNVCGLGEALAGARDALPFRQPKHEQAMVHTAIGFAKARRRLATLACTASIGPGATNLVTGAATATTNRLPVLLLPGDTFATRRQGVVLQQLRHPAGRDWTVNETLRPVSRFFDRIARPEQLLDALPEAMRVLLDPAETGAVTVGLHQDVQGEAYDYPEAFFAERTWHVPRRAPAADELARAVAAIRAAERPLVIAGGGVWHSAAEDALAAFADGLGVPVAETSAGKGTGRGELAVGGIGVNGTRAANELAAAADLVLCAGTRLSDFTTGSRSLFQAPDVRFVGLNVDAGDAHQLGALALVADAAAALEALGAALAGHRTAAAYRREVIERRERWERDVDADVAHAVSAGLTQSQVIRALNDACRPGDWIVAAAGSPPGDLLKLWRCVPGSHAHLEFAFSCMGHELPAALGIRMAEGDGGQVLALIGDGTYLMAPTELVTALQESLPVVAVVLVNGGFQSIHGLQRSTVAVSYGTEFRARTGGGTIAVDYAANARSLGCRAWDVRTADELRGALAAARSADGAALIACHVDPEHTPPAAGAWWDLGVPEVAAQPAVRERAEAVAGGRAKQRFYG